MSENRTLEKIPKTSTNVDPKFLTDIRLEATNVSFNTSMHQESFQ